MQRTSHMTHDRFGSSARRWRRYATWFGVVGALLLGTETAQAGDAHWWARNGVATPKPPLPTQNPGDYQGGQQGGQSPWTSGATGTPMTINANRWLFVGIENKDTGGAKDVDVTLHCSAGADLRQLEVGVKASPKPAAGGYSNSTASATWSKGSITRKSSTATMLRLTVSFASCPEWEYLTIRNNAANRTFQGFRITVGQDVCEQVARAGPAVSGDSRPSCECTTTGSAVTEIITFPESVPVDLGVLPFFDAPPSSGVWLHEWVFETPEGDPRPLGGARWFTAGPGLAAGETYSFSLSMVGDADARYDVFAFDETAGAYAHFVRDVRPQITAWTSRWSTSGSLGMALDPAATGDTFTDANPDDGQLPAVEPRLGGIDVIEVQLNRPVLLVNPGAVSVTDSAASYVPDSITLEGGGTSLMLQFAPGALPNERAYHVDVSGAVVDAANGLDPLVGDTDCVVIALLGDATEDGRVTDADVDLINASLGASTEPSTVALDLDLDGVITAADAAIAQANVGDTVLCPGIMPSVPWYEDFDDYDAGSTLHGGCGWKGWTNDPAFDAPVTDAEARSNTNALEMNFDGDLVHEYDGFDSGFWSYSAWQYIPSEFVSGGAAPFTGSYFILLDTYADAGPAHWAVGIGADSTTQSMRFFYGNGTDTNVVPFVTDRWVKIQSVIDLEDDWTRVYYDDELVTEYTWTGGIYGDGAGALDIAAVDLFANGSTSVYYDDLRLEPILGCGAGLTDDADGDGLSRLDEFLSGTDSCEADTDGDGVSDGVDNCPTTFNDDQQDSNDNGVGDACEAASSCPADLDASGDVGFGDVLALLGAWGPCAGPCPADLNGNGQVDFADVLALLGVWGPC